MVPMVESWTAALEATALARTLRSSVWAYPLINAGHLLGVALLLGGILPLDLKILGMWPSAPLLPLWRVLTRTAAVGLGLAVVCGALLFSTRAAAYAASVFFIAKMGVVAVGTVNALALHVCACRRGRGVSWEANGLPGYVRWSAGLSLAAWFTALILGRLVGYF